jgi:hypothetical protein
MFLFVLYHTVPQQHDSIGLVPVVGTGYSKILLFSSGTDKNHSIVNIFFCAQKT